MRNLLAITLALFLGCFGAIGLSHMSRGLTAPRNVVLEKVANMTSFELNDSNAFEVDGIRFETLVPERLLRIPPKLPSAKTQVQFGVRINNNTTTPRRFLLFSARPEFLQANKQKVQQFGPNANGSYNPVSADFQLVMPKESVTLLLEGYFHWQNHELKFVFLEKSGSCWIFSDFNSGAYSVQVIYENQYPTWEERVVGVNPLILSHFGRSKFTITREVTLTKWKMSG